MLLVSFADAIAQDRLRSSGNGEKDVLIALVRAVFRREARLLRWVLADFDIKVKMTTPGERPNHSLVLLGLLADPPAAPEAMLKRLRR